MTALHHTPGPWDFDFPYIVAPDPSGTHPDLYIAEVAREDEDGRVPPEDEQEANARLLAAAPELFAALAELVGEIDLATPSGRRAELVARAREVIAAVLAA